MAELQTHQEVKEIQVKEIQVKEIQVKEIQERRKIDWYEMNDNLKRLGEARIQHWKRQDEQYAKIELIQTKIKDLNSQLNYELKILRTILDKSPALYCLNTNTGNIINNTGNFTKP
jgi:hypothetical protein